MSARSPNGRPAIVKGADGMWHCSPTLGRHPVTGKRVRKHIKRATRRQVVDALQALEAECGDGPAAYAEGTVGEWFTQWLVMVDASLKPATYRSYRTAGTQYIIPRLGHIPLAKLSTEDIEKMLRWAVSPAGPGIAPVTAQSVRRVLRSCLNEAIRRRRLRHNPAVHARPPRGKPVEVPTIADADLDAILDAMDAGYEHRALMLAYIVTGARQNEILGLRRCDVDLDHATITISGALSRGTWKHGCVDPVACAAAHCVLTVCRQPCTRHRRACPAPCRPGCTRHARLCPQRAGGGLSRDTTKTDQTRTVPIPQELVAALREHLARSREVHFAFGTPFKADGYVFCDPESGRPVDPKKCWTWWSQLLQEAGVRHYRLHSTRHSFATQGLASGVDQRTMMSLSGWSSPAVAARYTHVVDAKKREASEAIADTVLRRRRSARSANPGTE